MGQNGGERSENTRERKEENETVQSKEVHRGHDLGKAWFGETHGGKQGRKRQVGGTAERGRES